MAGITQAERDRRSTEAFRLFDDRPLRLPIKAIAMVGPLERGYCPPCERRDWGAEIVLTHVGNTAFRCRACLRVFAEQILARASELAPGEREAVAALPDPVVERSGS